jgi:hypothetical protein
VSDTHVESSAQHVRRSFVVGSDALEIETIKSAGTGFAVDGYLLSTRESTKKHKVVAFVFALALVLLLNFGSWYPPLVKLTNAETRITYDKVLPLLPSTGLAARPGQYAGSVQVPQYIAGLNALDEDLASIKESEQRYSSSILVDETVPLGTNITIVPSLIDKNIGSRAAFVVPFVFLVDPQGNVRASYPWKDVPVGFGRVPEGLASEILDAINDGRLAFTHRIPSEQSSLGRWTVVVLWTDHASGVAMPFMAGGKASFKAEVPTTLWESPIEFARTILLMWTGPFLAVYGLLSKEETRRVAWVLAKNWIFMIGIVVMAIAFYLSYFVR